MDRLTYLLQEASKAFENKQSPFSHTWLTEHNVTADECYSLSMAISAAIDLFCIPLGKTEAKKER